MRAAHGHRAPAEELPERERPHRGQQAPVLEGARDARRIPVQVEIALLGRRAKRVAIELPGLLEIFRAKGANLHAPHATPTQGFRPPGRLGYAGRP
jgi:hypothetical protein